MNTMITEKLEKIEAKQGVRMCDFRQVSSQSGQKSVADVKMSHRAGVLAAICGFHEQKRAKKVILR